MDDATPRDAAAKRRAAGFSLALALIVAMPVGENLRPKPTDDFPLSYYPMFSADREDRQAVTHVVAIDEHGEPHTVPYRMLGSGGFNQVRRQLRKRARTDADAVCSDVARTLIHKGQRWEGARRLVVQTGTYQLSTYFTAHRNQLDVEVHASCDVRDNDEAS